MAARKGTSNFFRVLISALIGAVVSLTGLLLLNRFAGLDFRNLDQLLVISYGVSWPLNVVIYVAWSSRVYSRMNSLALRQATDDDDRDEQRPVQRVLNVTGATNTTISAAVIAVVVTIVIAQQPEFRTNPVYVLVALVTVASSWVLMVFSFAQSYLRLGAGERQGAHFRFLFPDMPRFGDYVDLALMLSSSAATVSAEATSRVAWRVVRANVVIAFVFNSVIIAMMVSLLFGGFLE